MINTLTLNPAIDKILYLRQVEKGITNRICSYTNTVGGKGTHVSMNLTQLGVQNQAFGFSCGSAGKYVVRMLEEWGVTTRFLHKEEDESRTNYILLEEDNTCTTIAEKGPRLSEADLQELVALMLRHIHQGDFVVFSGDASNCPDPFVYNYIAKQLAHKKVKLFLDSSGETLRKGLECSPFLIKPNQDELEALCGFPLATDEDVMRGIASLDPYGIEVVAVSLGGRGAIARFGNDYYRTTPPEVKVRNTAGCGDSFLASLLFGFETKMSPTEMLRLATAVSSATAASPLSVGFDKDYASELLSTSKVERIQ